MTRSKLNALEIGVSHCREQLSNGAGKLTDYAVRQLDSGRPSEVQGQSQCERPFRFLVSKFVAKAIPKMQSSMKLDLRRLLAIN